MSKDLLIFLYLNGTRPTCCSSSQERGESAIKQLFLLLLSVFALAACTAAQQPTQHFIDTLPPDTAITKPPEQADPPDEPTQVQNKFAPKPGDATLARRNIFIEQASLLIRESYPPQIVLRINGELPTPCHQLRVQVGAPHSSNEISAEAYSVVNPDMICTQVVKPFDENVELGTFRAGYYSVLVNGELIGEFDS